MGFEFRSVRASLAAKAAVPAVFLTVSYKKRGRFPPTPRTFEVDGPGSEVDGGQARAQVKAEAAADPGALAGAWRVTARRVEPSKRVRAAPLPDSPAVINVLANASDIDSLVLTSLMVTGPQHGALALNGDGSFSYAPDSDYFGSDSFTYKANNGLVDSNTATVTVTIAE
jgi:hypothetical protein